MRICNTPEMDRLKKIYEPYLDGVHLVKNAPASAVEAFEKFNKLFDEEVRHWIEIELSTTQPIVIKTA